MDSRKGSEHIRSLVGRMDSRKGWSFGSTQTFVADMVQLFTAVTFSELWGQRFRLRFMHDFWDRPFRCSVNLFVYGKTGLLPPEESGAGARELISTLKNRRKKKCRRGIDSSNLKVLACEEKVTYTRIPSDSLSVGDSGRGCCLPCCACSCIES